jgi:hypothetical protein
MTLIATGTPKFSDNSEKEGPTGLFTTNRVA